MKRNPFEKYLGKEDILQRQVIEYLELKYKVTPICMGTESRKTPFEQFKFKWMGGRKGVSDLFIPKPSGMFSGLFIELKREGAKIFKKNGDLYASNKDHHQRQLDFINDMSLNGYMSAMCIGFDSTKSVIDSYFSAMIKL
tara:strand:+ start:101 stop:520 length:420 start_codon:yes stop_codon:yes gene_type:complete